MSVSMSVCFYSQKRLILQCRRSINPSIHPINGLDLDLNWINPNPHSSTYTSMEASSKRLPDSSTISMISILLTKIWRFLEIKIIFKMFYTGITFNIQYKFSKFLVWSQIEFILELRNLNQHVSILMYPCQGLDTQYPNLD